MAWVKACCDACGYVPPHQQEEQSYRDLVEMYLEELSSRGQNNAPPSATGGADNWALACHGVAGSDQLGPPRSP